MLWRSEALDMVSGDILQTAGNVCPECRVRGHHGWSYSFETPQRID